MQQRSDDGGGLAAVALVADMMFASRVGGAARAVGVEVRTVTSPVELWEVLERDRPPLVLIDLEHRGLDAAALVAEIKAPADPPVIVAFGSHVNREALLSARAAGADHVLARSAFVRELPAILRGDFRSVPRERD
jgi:CheY-like chemotaxis protein